MARKPPPKIIAHALATKERMMSKETTVQPATDVLPDDSADARPRRLSPDELPDGSGNDAPKHPELGDENRFDAG